MSETSTDLTRMQVESLNHELCRRMSDRSDLRNERLRHLLKIREEEERERSMREKDAKKIILEEEERRSREREKECCKQREWVCQENVEGSEETRRLLRTLEAERRSEERRRRLVHDLRIAEEERQSRALALANKMREDAFDRSPSGKTFISHLAEIPPSSS